jgi:tryptophan-rich sensory protein
MLGPKNFGENSGVVWIHAAVSAAFSAWLMWRATAVGGSEAWTAFAAGCYALNAVIAAASARQLAHEKRERMGHQLAPSSQPPTERAK